MRKALWLGAWVISSATLAAQEVTPETVNRAIERGIDYLKSRQRNHGGWDDFPGYSGGVTALATLALLSCDVPADSPVIQRALAVLRTVPREHTYVVALQTMALAAANPAADIAQIRQNARWLMETRTASGAWHYGTERGGFPDNSNSQFALLGLQAAREAGVDVPDRFWEQCRNYWVQAQSPRGPWGYRASGDASASMTAAGISSLVISGRELQNVRPGVYRGQRVRCNGMQEDRNLQAAINWIGRVFIEGTNPGGPEVWLYYYMYGLERAGRLTGRRFFGEHDWYRAGARFMIRRQNPDGSWSPGRGADMHTQYNTAFALLFLSKGKIPIIINKLQHGADQDWNNAPNDVHNLTHFVAARWNVKLNWQVVRTALPTLTVQDLMQAPILQLSGHEPLQLTPREKQLLREYIDQGGLIVADANCSIKDFDDSFRALCKELFPEPGQELRRLDEGHGVWNSMFQLQPNWPLHGIEIGCRTAVFYSPEDLSCQWEHKNDPNSVAAFRLGANIVAYAVGPEDLADKLADRKIYKKTEDEIRRNFLHIAKLKHNGDWNPAPRAIPNLMAALRQMIRIDVVQQQRDLEILDPNLPNYPLCYMHGRNRFTVNQRERQVLLEHLKNGGVLFADACCGNERFDQAFRTLMTQMFPDRKFEPIPVNHELFSEEIGHDCKSVEFGKALGGRKGPPVFEGIQIDGRFVVVYSKWDIGCALERQKSTDCKGYTHESAIKLATNVVLYALKQ